MRHIVAVLALAAFLVAPPAAATDEADAFAPVKQFIEGFNRGDAKTALAACAPSAVIIDELAPYLWQGANACTTWADAYDADAKANGITDGVVKLGKPRHVFVAGDKAYVVVPTQYDYKKKGAEGWRITGWSWATGK